MTKRIFPLSAFVLVLMAGCTPAEDEITEALPNQVAFEGKVDERLLGTWKADEADSTYEFFEDGKYHLTGTISVQGNTMENDSWGEWKVNGDEALFKDAQGSVAAYKLEMEGDVVKMTIGKKNPRTTTLRKVESKAEEEK